MKVKMEHKLKNVTDWINIIISEKMIISEIYERFSSNKNRLFGFYFRFKLLNNLNDRYLFKQF